MRYTEQLRRERKIAGFFQGLMQFFKHLRVFAGVGFCFAAWYYVPNFVTIFFATIFGFAIGIAFVVNYRHQLIESFYPRVWLAECDSIMIQDNNPNSEIKAIEIPIIRTENKMYFVLRGEPNFLARVKKHYAKPEKKVQPEVLFTQESKSQNSDFVEFEEV